MPDRDAASAPLAKFDGEKRCVKCGGDAVLTVWHAGRAYASEHTCAAVLLFRTSYPPEHLCRTCQRCHYRWPESTEDSHVSVTT